MQRINFSEQKKISILKCFYTTKENFSFTRIITCHSKFRFEKDGKLAETTALQKVLIRDKVERSSSDLEHKS